MSELNQAPVMFISHGSPMFAVDTGEASQLLNNAGEFFADCKAVVVISAHWLTRGLAITASDQLETIHDFGGFPPELYRLKYAAPGSSSLALEVSEQLASAGFATTLDQTRGRDHGVWVPMLHLLPAARLPVVQLSLPTTVGSDTLVKMGVALAALRSRGIAIIGSGSLTHNLYELRHSHESTAPYVEDFVAWVDQAVNLRDFPALQNPARFHPDYQQAHPTPDHYWPLLVALGASSSSDRLQILNGGVQHYSISMKSYLWTN